MDTSASRQTFETRAGFADAIAALLIQLVQPKVVSTVILCDPTFEDWPLNRPDVLDALTQWANPVRKLILLGNDYDRFGHLHARWLNWRKLRSHVVDVRITDPADRDALPSLALATPVACVKRAVAQPSGVWRGWASNDLHDMARYTELIGAALQRSSPSLPVTTLGL